MVDLRRGARITWFSVLTVVTVTLLGTLSLFVGHQGTPIAFAQAALPTLLGALALRGSWLGRQLFVGLTTFGAVAAGTRSGLLLLVSPVDSALYFGLGAVWLSSGLALGLSPDARAYLNRERNGFKTPTGPGSGIASNLAKSVHAITRLEWRFGRLGAGTALHLASLFAMWAISSLFWRNPHDFPGIRGGSYGLFRTLGIVMIALTTVASVLSFRGSPYGRGWVMGSTLWFSLRALYNIKRAASPSRWVPDVERALPVGFGYLVAFTTFTLFAAVLVWTAQSTADPPEPRNERWVKIGCALAVGFVAGMFLGRPPLLACQGEFPRGPGDREFVPMPHLCAGFCVDAQRGPCDYDACRAARDAPCETFSASECPARSECSLVGY